jgi:hypothetical protein
MSEFCREVLLVLSPKDLGTTAMDHASCCESTELIVSARLSVDALLLYVSSSFISSVIYKIS